MSNYLSQDIQYNKPPTDANFELLAKVALAQQQKYDVNHQQIQQTLDQFGAIKTLRPEDDAYIAAKLNSITTQLNSAGGNLASQSLTDSLMGKIKGVAQDPFILNALEQTSKMKTYQKELAIIKEKKPELYNDVNNSFALHQAGFADYMAGKKDKLGTLTYSPYVDVTKSTLEKVKQLKDLRGEQTINAPILDSAGNPTGRTVKRTIKGLTEEEIFQYFPDLLTSAESNQLVIDGWNIYKDKMPIAQAEFKAHTDSKEKMIDESIAQAQSIVNNTTNNDDKRAEARERIKSLNAQKANLTAIKQSIDLSDPVQLGGYLHQKSFQNSIAEMAQAKWSEEYGVDEYYFDKANLEIKMEELSIAKEKLELEKKEKGLVPSEDVVAISTREGEPEKELEPIKQLKGQYNETYNEMIAITKGAYNSDRTTPEMREQFKAEMNRMGYDENGAVINQELANKNSKASAFKLAFTESNMNYIHGDVAKKLSGLETKRAALANEFGTIERDAMSKKFNEDPDKYVNSLFSSLSEVSDLNKPVVYESAMKKVSDFYTKVTGKNLSNTDKLSIITGATSKISKEIKDALRNSPKKIAEFSKILDDTNKSAESFLTNPLFTIAGVGKTSLSKDYESAANEALMQKTKDGKNVFFNTSNIATIKNENVRKNIIQMLPQDSDTALFDSNNPISFYKNKDGSITIKQNKGFTTGKEQVGLRDAEVTVDKEDAAYKELIKYVELDESKKGLDASRTKIEVKPYRAPFYLDNRKGDIISNVDQQMIQLPTNMVNALFIGHPSNYLTKERTEEIYLKALKDKVPAEKISSFVDELSSNLSRFKIKLYPFDGQWSIQLNSPEGDIITSGGTGMVNLEEDAAGLVENYPQTLISDWVLREVIKNPKQIDTILK